MFCARLRALIADFRDDSCGVTAILFAAVAVPVLGLGLAAIDFGRAQTTKTEIQSAADSAASAGAKLLGHPRSEIEATIRGFLRTNLPANRREMDFVLIFGPDDTSLTVRLNSSVPTSILGIVGVKELDIAVESRADKPDPIKQLQSPHRGVVPELPPAFSNGKGLDGMTADDLKQAEQQARRILDELQRSGGDREVQELLRGLSQLR